MSEASNPQYIVYLEIVGSCNLACPSCAVGNYRKRAKVQSPNQLMEFSLYRQLVDKLKVDLKDKNDPMICLFNWGEPLLHPQIGDMVAYAKDAGFRVGLSSNLNQGRHLKSALEGRPDEFVISLSGSQKETYEKTHRKGRYQNVIDNMHQLSDLMLDHPDYQTEISVHYHVYRHNSGEDIQMMAELCDRLGFNLLLGIAFYMPVENLISIYQEKSGIKEEDSEILENLLVPLDEQFDIAKNNRDSKVCILATDRLDIDVDGAVKLCCASYDRISNISDDFLQIEFEAIEEKKKDADLCRLCSSLGLNRIYTMEDIESWRAIANRELEKNGRDLRFITGGYDGVELNTESALQNKALIALNANQKEIVLDTYRQLYTLLNQKYGIMGPEDLLDRFELQNSRLGYEMPLDPLRLIFMEIVILRNYCGQKEQAKTIATRVLDSIHLLNRFAGYRQTLAELETIISDWRNLPI